VQIKKKNMRISIIGSGHVGLITGACLAEKGIHNVLCIDNDKKKIANLRNKKVPFYEPGLEALVIKNVDEKRLNFSTSIKEGVDFGEVIFISVGTPSTLRGCADLSYVVSVAKEIGRNLSQYRLIVEKSTVPVKTGEKIKKIISKYAKKNVKFDVASNPEFLREGTAISDTMNPERIIIGTESKKAEKILRNIYANFNSPILITDITSAELIKLSANSFLAMKVSFINAVAVICELANANVAKVAEGIGMDSRIGRSFLHAGIGYGGFCLPKDVNAFISVSKALGYNFRLLKEVKRININAQEHFVRKMEQELGNLKDKTIAALGLSFKPNTDDIRESPAIAIIKILLSKGAKIQAYDPVAIAETKKVLQNIIYCTSPYKAVENADCVAILTEWNEFKKLDLARIKKLLNKPIVFDGRNIFDVDNMKKLGFIYRSIGRG